MTNRGSQIQQKENKQTSELRNLSEGERDTKMVISAELSKAMVGINPIVRSYFDLFVDQIFAFLPLPEGVGQTRENTFTEEKDKSLKVNTKDAAMIYLLNEIKKLKENRSNLHPEVCLVKVLNYYNSISGVKESERTNFVTSVNHSTIYINLKELKFDKNFRESSQNKKICKLQSLSSSLIILQPKGWNANNIPETLELKKCAAGHAVFHLRAVILQEKRTDKDKTGPWVCVKRPIKGKKYCRNSTMFFFYEMQKIKTSSEQTSTDKLVFKLLQKKIYTINVYLTLIPLKEKPASPEIKQIPDELSTINTVDNSESFDAMETGVSDNSDSLKEEEIEAEFKYGLRNLGNTCFMNSALNGLYSLRSFRSYFITQENQSPLMKALVQFCSTHTRQQVQSDLLYQFKNAIPEFSDGRQHCANSYVFKLLMLLDTLLPTPPSTTFPQDIFGNKLRQYRKGKCEPLHDIFGSLAENLFICTVCSNTRRNFSYFRTVDVPIPYYAETSGEVTMFSPNNFYPGPFAKVYTGTEVSETIYRQEFLRRSQKLPASTSLPTLSRTDLSQCFKYMLRASLMSPQSLMQCDDCGEETQHYKQSFFRQLSTTLVIHFQRFDERNGTKLDTPVDFPMVLDMSDYCVNDPRKYQLCGVVYHFGSLDFGHYTACIKVRGRWYDVNDSSVREVRDKPQSESAYMLFYEENSN